jgi:hypothetical protein
MTDPTPDGDDRADFARRLIAARCPELGPSDLAMLAEADPDMLPVAIGAQILDVLQHLMDRMDALEQTVRVGA